MNPLPFISLGVNFNSQQAFKIHGNIDREKSGLDQFWYKYKQHEVICNVAGTLFWYEYKQHVRVPHVPYISTT